MSRPGTPEGGLGPGLRFGTPVITCCPVGLQRSVSSGMKSCCGHQCDHWGPAPHPALPLCLQDLDDLDADLENLDLEDIDTADVNLDDDFLDD